MFYNHKIFIMVEGDRIVMKGGGQATNAVTVGGKKWLLSCVKLQREAWWKERRSQP